MDAPYRIGIIGLGNMGWRYFDVLRRSPRWQLAWICDRDPQRLAHARQQDPTIQATADANDLFTDPTLDVVGIHGAGGIVGVVGLGFLATGWEKGSPGLFYGGPVSVLGKQVAAMLAVGAYAFLVTYIIGKVIDRFFRIRTTEEEQARGLDAGFTAG